MKYIDADKLVAEIERLTNQKKKQLERFSDEDYCCSVASSINCRLSGNLEALSIIKSLQQEQPEVDLEKEVKSYIKDNYTIMDEVAKIPEEDRMYAMREDDMRAFAKHFYELGLNARKEE